MLLSFLRPSFVLHSLYDTMQIQYDRMPIAIWLYCMMISSSVSLYLLLTMDQVLLLLLVLSSKSFLPQLLFELFLCSSSSLVAAAMMMMTTIMIMSMNKIWHLLSHSLLHSENDLGRIN